MSIPIIAFFNNKGGVGKTSLVYHIAWMYAELGIRVLAVDLDPQANLTAAFLDEDRLAELWDEDEKSETIHECIRPLLEGTGDIGNPHIEEIGDNLSLIPGDLALSSFEDELSQQWPQCADGKPRAFRVITAFWRAIRKASLANDPGVVLVDVGPNLGAINRAALVASDHVVVPLSPDLFSLQGLKNLGPTLRRWRAEWTDRVARNPDPKRIELPAGNMCPAGYLVLQHAVRLDRPVKAYARWMRRIPGVYRQSVLDQDPGAPILPDQDPHCIGLLKHYRSLMPMAQEAHRPMFLLRPVDGAMGAHQAAVGGAWNDFSTLARRIAERTGLDFPETL
ncbi:AAA family ATPase [Sorangium sp. So ce1036]|uniref:ParA family protein n=1 Tax=Sorangium sp. So ce1036 TaxID=3133328 RepID=UPI003F1066E9